MISIVEHIEYLIHRNDCVIIPGWGALISQYAPAYFDMQSGIVLSPSKSISFNSSINHNDGLIADSIRRKENISFNEAQSLVNEEVATLKKQLNLCGEVSLGKLGSFKLKDEVVVFEPYALDNAQSELFGLSNLKIATLDKINSDSDIAVSEHKSVVNSVFSRNILKYAASIILLIGMSLVLTTPISIKNNDVELASFNVVDLKKQSSEVLEKETRTLYLAIPDETESETEEPIGDKVAEPVRQNKKVAYDVSALTNIDNAKYYLIVASLPTRDLAEKHIEQCHDNNMSIIECDGKFRVYVASSNSFKDLQSVINNSSISQKYPGTWICKKK